eukprot:g16547.t1
MGWKGKGNNNKGHGAGKGAGKGNQQDKSWRKPWSWANSAQANNGSAAGSESGKRPAASDSVESAKVPAGGGEWYEVTHEGRVIWAQGEAGKGKGQSSSASASTASAVAGKRQKTDGENKLELNQDEALAAQPKAEEYSEAVLAAATSAKVTLPTANQANVELANAAMRGAIEWGSFEHLEEPSYWLGKTSLSMGAVNGCCNLLMTTLCYVFAGLGQNPLLQTLQNPRRAFEWGMDECLALCQQAYSNFGEVFSDLIQGWTSKIELVKSLCGHLSADSYEHGKARASISRLIGWCAPYTRLVKMAHWPGSSCNAFAACYVNPMMEAVLLGLPMTGIVKIFYTLSANFPGSVDVQQCRDFLLGAQQVFGLRMGGAAELDTGIIQTLLGSAHAKGERKSKFSLVLRHVCQNLSKVDETDLSADGDAGSATLDKSDMEEFLKFKEAKKNQGSAGSSTDVAKNSA